MRKIPVLGVFDMADFPGWQNGFRHPWPVQTGHCQTDIAIVGGGLTGVTTALMLSALGARVTLLERGRLGDGATWGCLGQLRPLDELQQRRIQFTAGRDAASVFARLNDECIPLICEMIDRLGLYCGLTRYSDGTFGLMPLLYLLGIAEYDASMGCHIHEQSAVRQIAGHRLITDHGSVTAQTIILATGVPLGCQRMRILSTLEQHVFEMRWLSGSIPDMIQDPFLPSCLELRMLPDGMLIRCDLGLSGTQHARKRAALAQDLRTHFPAMQTVGGCFRQEVFARDGLPSVGQISKPNPHILSATGYSGYGLTGSFLAARLLAGEIFGKPLAEAPIFAPARCYSGHLLTEMNGALRIMTAYAAGFPHHRAPKCPHMGCRLRYSRSTRRWECPCHGSAFDESGQIRCAPAKAPAAVSPRRSR